MLPGCANMLPPEGGLRDTLPPLLVKATPAYSATNFKGQRLVFVFDEFVDVNNVQQNLLITPLPQAFPDVNNKLRTITVKFRDTLEANTTYTLNFTNAIKDINEGNTVKNLTYVFSTGPALDSLTLRGKVILAETGKIDSTLIVILHKNPKDSVVVSEKPRYVTGLNATGEFSFKNLPAGKFYIYALKNEGGSYRYQSAKQLFAFADSGVTAGSSTPITLYAYAEADKPIITINTNPTKRVRNEVERLRPVPNTLTGSLDLYDDFTLSFDQPLKDLDTSLVQLTADTVFTPIKGYRILLDSLRKKISIRYNWQQDTKYNLILDKNFAADTLGRKLLKTDTIVFKTKKLSDYGSLRIRFKNLDLSKNPVLQILQNDNIVKSVVLTGNIADIPLINPATYELRILYDRNKNGKWDPGEFFGKHLQPEIAKPIGRTVTVKVNWDNEFDIEAPPLTQ